MSDILIKPEEYYAKLEEINSGFLESDWSITPVYNDPIKSNFPSMLALLHHIIKMDTALKSYDTFLKNDVAECVKIGENFEEIDQAYQSALGGGA